MSKKILIINGHPDKDSLCFALANTCKEGAVLSGTAIRERVITDLGQGLTLPW